MQPVRTKSNLSNTVSRNRILLIFILPLIAINILQGFFTELFNDEAYYFYYSRDLEWGYYDHPPLIALMIRLGYLLFRDELGVRLFFILLSLGTMALIYLQSGVKHDLLFCVTAFSIIAFHITGFMAVPDTPLLFFTALFFFVYKRYLERDGLDNAILLGLVMAGLFYSKYLGILIIFFTVISNLKLLLRKSFWLAVVVTTVAFLPHLVWQYRNDFPTFYYHLVERSHDSHFRWNNFGDYFAGQLALLNPFLFFILIWFLFREKSAGLYERALKYAAVGGLVLPVLLMFRGRVEANWTMAAFVPLFIFTYQIIENRPRFHRYIFITGGLTLFLIGILRIFAIVNFLPAEYKTMIRLESHGNKEFYDQLGEIADDRPVVIIGNYQKPSKYLFYEGKKAFAFNDWRYRDNQYDLEGWENHVRGKEVAVFFFKPNLRDIRPGAPGLASYDSIMTRQDGPVYYVFDQDYRSYNDLQVEIRLMSGDVKCGEKLEMEINLRNPYAEPVTFAGNTGRQAHLILLMLKEGKQYQVSEIEDISGLLLTDGYTSSFGFLAPSDPGIYYLRVSIQNDWLPPGINSRLMKLNVSR